MKISRRQLFSIALGLPFLPNFAWAGNQQSLGQKRLVLIILRGGLDGLTAVPATSDPEFEKKRGILALSKQGNDAALPLDSFFGLHPLLKSMHQMYQEKELLAVHAVATPYRGRSHFDAQNLLETGASTPFSLASGWLNRALEVIAPTSIDSAVSISNALPLVLQGPAKVSSHAPQYKGMIDQDLMARLARLYAPYIDLKETFERARAALDTTQRAGIFNPQSQHSLSLAAQAAARLLRLEIGPRIAVLEADGYDSHATQSSMIGIPARELRGLDAAMQHLKQGLETVWQRTLVLVVTEFGRSVVPNGAQGTDHGIASAMFLAGGAVRGGRIIADWPGLKEKDLHEQRDLTPTTDLFAVINSALSEHWQIDISRLNKAITHGRNFKHIPGLIHT
jgi:uncharacterized protein (DUF1501 family)